MKLCLEWIMALVISTDHVLVIRMDHVAVIRMDHGIGD